MNFQGTSIKSRVADLPRPTVVMALAVFCIPVLTLHVPLSLATLLPVLALIAIIGRFVSGAPRFRFNKMSIVVVAAIIILAAASAAWSFSVELTWDKLTRTAIIALIGLVFVAAMSGLDRAQSRIILTAFLAGFLGALALVVVERVIGEILVGTQVLTISVGNFLDLFNRPLALFAIMIWPAALILSDRRPLYGVVAVILCLGLFATFQTGAATAGVVLGAIVFACVYAAPRIMAPLTGAVLGLSVLLAPTIEETVRGVRSAAIRLSSAIDLAVRQRKNCGATNARVGIQHLAGNTRRQGKS